MKGPLIILSGPSGAGKSTLMARLLAVPDLPLHKSVSVTTRPPRGREVEGDAYHYWSRDRFEAERQAGGFLEWAEVFGSLYGTLKREVEPYRERGQGVLLEIDVQGAAQVRRQCPDAVSIFLHAPSLEVYEQRLRARGTDSEPSIRRRVETARREEARATEYDYHIINDDLDRASAELTALVRRQFGGEADAG